MSSYVFFGLANAKYGWACCKKLPTHQLSPGPAQLKAIRSKETGKRGEHVALCGGGSRNPILPSIEVEASSNGGGRQRERRRRGRVLPAVLRGAQGQVRPRVPRVRVPPRRQAPLRQQLQLQERHHDPQGGLRLTLRPARGKADHPGVGDYEGRRQQLAGARPRRQAGARDRHGQRTHLLHHLQDRIPRRRADQQGPRGPPHLLLPRPGSEMFCVFAY